MPAGKGARFKGDLRTVSVNDLAAGRTRSAGHGGMRRLRQPAQASESAMLDCSQRQGRVAGKSIGLMDRASTRACGRDTRPAKTSIGKRKAPEPGSQELRTLKELACKRRQTERRQEVEPAAATAKAAPPRPVAVLGRSCVPGRRPTASVTWDGETYSVCGFGHSQPCPLTC